MPDSMQDLHDKLASEIPVSQHLGVTVGAYDGTCLVLRAPLAQNVNHEGTAFAGSVNAVATLAGWSLVWLELRQAGLAAHIVIQDSAINYHRPIDEDFEAHCCLGAPDAATRLRESLRRHRRGRVRLTVDVRTRGVSVAVFKGRYVAFLDPVGTR